jgi:hypothetical protein
VHQVDLCGPGKDEEHQSRQVDGLVDQGPGGMFGGLVSFSAKCKSLSLERPATSPSGEAVIVSVQLVPDFLVTGTPVS